MAKKPKPLFWIVLIVIVSSLLFFSLRKAGILGSGSSISLLPSETLELTFYTSSAKKKWINAMVDEFNADRHKVSGKVIQIKQFHVNSGDSFDQIKDGTIQPDMWSPGDESWLHLLSAHWNKVHQKEIFKEYYPLVDIPLVIAMWEPMANVLGYPKQISWKDIDKVATNPSGWAAYGHPEWGKFRWGHAHPDANSGFLAVLSEVYAASGKTKGLTASDLKRQNVISFLRDIEGAVEHYGLSNSWIDNLMHLKGPAYLSCAVQYENTIIQTNEEHQNTPFKLVAVYPKEGNMWTQHPVAVLNESWMTPEKEEASKEFITFLLSKDSQEKAMELGLRPIMKELQLAAPFDEDHGIIRDVSAFKRFTVPDEDVLKRIRDLWEDVKMPASVILVMDTSGSMNGTPIDNARKGAADFIRHMKPRDQLKVVTFNNRVNTLIDMCSIRDCGEKAARRIEGVFAQGGTALYEAVAKTYRELKETRRRNPKRRYSILVLSDGKDTSSKMSVHDFMDILPKTEDYDVPKIFTIAYGDEADKDLLAEIANKTNARLFTSTTEDIMKTYKELSANF